MPGMESAEIASEVKRVFLLLQLPGAEMDSFNPSSTSIRRILCGKDFKEHYVPRVRTLASMQLTGTTMKWYCTSLSKSGRLWTTESGPL
jgi:hypothetical protein